MSSYEGRYLHRLYTEEMNRRNFDVPDERPHPDDVMHGAATELTGIIISRIADGRVIEEWEEINRLGLLEQIGALSGADGQLSLDRSL